MLSSSRGPLPLEGSLRYAGPVLPEAHSSNPDSSAAPLVDREAEIGAMRAALEAALRGSGRIVVLAGEPGIG